MKTFAKLLVRFFVSILPQPYRARHSQELHIRWRLGWLKGWIWRPYWMLRSCLRVGPRVILGKRFCLSGSLRFAGQGTVIFGDDVIIGDNCTPFTGDKHSVIQVGHRTFLNGTRFGCVQSIEIGDDCIIADARIMDTDFHAVHRRRNEPGMIPMQSAVKIGNNVWICAGSAILKGVEIGHSSVVAFGSVVVKSIPEGRIFAGNPAKDIGPVPEGP